MDNYGKLFWNNVADLPWVISVLSDKTGGNFIKKIAFKDVSATVCLSGKGDNIDVLGKETDRDELRLDVPERVSRFNEYKDIKNDLVESLRLNRHG